MAGNLAIRFHQQARLDAAGDGLSCHLLGDPGAAVEALGQLVRHVVHQRTGGQAKDDSSRGGQASRKTVPIRDSFLESLLYDPPDQASPDARRNASPDSSGPAVSCRCKGPTRFIPRPATAFAPTTPPTSRGRTPG